MTGLQSFSYSSPLFFVSSSLVVGGLRSWNFQDPRRGSIAWTSPLPSSNNILILPKVKNVKKSSQIFLPFSKIILKNKTIFLKGLFESKKCQDWMTKRWWGYLSGSLFSKLRSWVDIITSLLLLLLQLLRVTSTRACLKPTQSHGERTETQGAVCM